MARQNLDGTGNEPWGVVFGKLNSMLTELYSSFAGATDPSVTTLTTSGAATIGGALTASSTAAVTGQVTAGALALDSGTKTASATTGAATLNKDAGVITSEALTTAAGAAYTLTLTNSSIAAADQVFASFANGTNTQGTLSLGTVTPGSGSVVIKVNNIHASEALNGTIKIAFMVLKN